MIKPIVTNYRELRKPCAKVVENEDVKSIVQDLRDTLEKQDAFGLSANQIGVQKAISVMRFPKPLEKGSKKVEFQEVILINPKIVNKGGLVRVMNEVCVSFPNLKIETGRYSFIIVEFLNEKLQKQTAVFQNLEAVAVQHETDHGNGKTILEAKWRAR